MIEKNRFVSTGYSKLDDIIIGLEKSNLYILGGATETGKTLFALNIMSNIKKLDKKVALFSYETTQQKLIEKLYAISSNNSYNDVLFNNLNEVQKKELLMYRFELSYSIFTEPRMTLNYIADKARKEQDFDLIIIDNLHSIGFHKYLEMDYSIAREQEIAYYMRNLKSLAIELEIPILVVSQMNRQGGNGKPLMKNLKDSGAIENEADVVMLIHRNEFENNMNDGNEIIVAKNRDGSKGNITLEFDTRSLKISEPVELPFPLSDNDGFTTLQSKGNNAEFNKKLDLDSYDNEPPF